MQMGTKIHTINVNIFSFGYVAYVLNYVSYMYLFRINVFSDESLCFISFMYGQYTLSTYDIKQCLRFGYTSTNDADFVIR